LAWRSSRRRRPAADLLSEKGMPDQGGAGWRSCMVPHSRKASMRHRSGLEMKGRSFAA
jgi:hypothetical protein